MKLSPFLQLSNMGRIIAFVRTFILLLIMSFTSFVIIYTVSIYITLSPWREFSIIWLSLILLSLILSILRSLGYHLSLEQRWNSEHENIQAENITVRPEFLLQTIRKSALEFERSTRWHYRNVRIYKYSTVLLTTLATIVLGINVSQYFIENNKELALGITKDVALVINAIAAALSTLALFWNIEKYWIQNKIIKHQLRLLQQELEFEMSKGNTNDIVVQKNFNSYQEILRSFHLYWEGALSEQKTSTASQNNNATTTINTSI